MYNKVCYSQAVTESPSAFMVEGVKVLRKQAQEGILDPSVLVFLQEKLVRNQARLHTYLKDTMFNPVSNAGTIVCLYTAQHLFTYLAGKAFQLV
jgi:hypothetical protein